MAVSVCVGRVTSAHGIKGEVKVKSFTADPTDLMAYGSLYDESGRELPATLKGQIKGSILVRFDHIKDRNGAEEMRGTRLYVPRSALPNTEEDEFLHSDLVGMRVETEEGELLGIVNGIMDFGAGDVLDIRHSNGDSSMMSFTKVTVPVVDLIQRRLVVSLPIMVETSEA